MAVDETREQKIERLARKIALAHDLDPDDARLGYPAWRIPWVLQAAEEKLNESPR